MYDWLDDFVIQACQSFPNLRYYIMQCADMGDTEQLMEFLLALSYENRKDT